MWEKIETWVEHHYPSFPFTAAQGTGNRSIRRGIGGFGQSISITIYNLLRRREPAGKISPTSPMLRKARREMEWGENRSISWQLLAFVGEITLFLFVVAGLSVWGMLYFVDGGRWTWWLCGGKELGEARLLGGLRLVKSTLRRCCGSLFLGEMLE
jgi:hypothetical protein